ncbi:MAG: DUF1501 domain-containing protein [Rhodoferax sp.]|nr:DUF1501 domain-containing protein [Rhodoferax sp.]
MYPSISIQRRQVLRALGLAAGTTLLPPVWAQGAAGLKNGRLVVVFLRGAYDGLSATVPYADPDYARLRPSTAIAAPDGSGASALKLDARFALHPALAPLLPLWHSGVLGFIPAAGSPDPSRSHFEAQNHWEIGVPGKSNAPRGWLNTLAEIGAGGGSAPLAIGVGEANPKILSGPVVVRLIPKGKSATQEGVLGNQRTRQALMDLYAGPDAVSSAFRQGADSRMSSAQELNQEMMASDNGAASAAGLLLDAQHLGTLMRNDRHLRLGFLSAGGWDTHANQGAVTGALSQNLAKLAQALVQLRQDFSESGDVIAVVSEFGRTAAENGTRGTDHGHGNTLWLIGNRINGGRWHGEWSGLSSGNLHEARDLPVHHDFRSVFSQVLRGGFGLADRQLQDVFPGATFDARLAGLLRPG